ncbi:MAG: DUF6089 family protein [Flammeovirgaceae bacterium]
MKNLLCLLLSLLAFSSFSQSFYYAARRERSLIFTGGLGTSSYYGDLANSSDIIGAQPNVNIGLQNYFSNRIGGRVELNWFILDGDDAKATSGGRDQRNLSFQSSNFELSAVGIVNLYAHGNRYYRRPSFNLYGFAGVGLLYFNPKAKDPLTGNLVALQPLQTEGNGYSLVAPTIPFGLGVRLKVTPQLNVAIEGGWRKVFTDYLDDVSGPSYLGTAAFSNPLAARMSDKRVDAQLGLPSGVRGNPTSDDAYMLLNVKIEYYLPLDFGGGGNRRSYSKKRGSMYRYNRNGRLRK